MVHNGLLKRFWIKFDLTNYQSYHYIRKGCGVTAYSAEDALNLLKQCMFKNEEMPQVLEIIEDVDIRTLDQNHIVTNMGVPTRRGIWFPLGYELL